MIAVITADIKNQSYNIKQSSSSLATSISHSFVGRNITDYSLEHFYGTRLTFPVIGEKNRLYIDTDTNDIWYWNSEKLHYFRPDSVRDIKQIKGVIN